MLMSSGVCAQKQAGAEIAVERECHGLASIAMHGVVNGTPISFSHLLHDAACTNELPIRGVTFDSGVPNVAAKCLLRRCCDGYPRLIQALEVTSKYSN